jgi:predicted transcriptional regulator
MPTTIATAKQRALEIVQDLPEDSSYEDILRELAFERVIERGLADAEAGRTISSEEMKRRIESWAK